jgi:hypothetical protein
MPGMLSIFFAHLVYVIFKGYILVFADIQMFLVHAQHLQKYKIANISLNLQNKEFFPVSKSPSVYVSPLQCICVPLSVYVSPLGATYTYPAGGSNP